MSTQSDQQRDPTRECRHPECDELGRKWEFRDGEYCGTECQVRHAGREVLVSLLYDHRVCFTCFRDLKTVNPPKPDFEFTERGHGWTLDEDGEPTLEFFDQEVTREAATGFQFLTGDATKGEKQRGERVITGTICDACGQTDHTDHDATLADREAIARLIDRLGDDDDHRFDPVQLHREYEHHADLQLAVGRALDD